MKYEDIITLAKAGYTAEQIFAMENPPENNNELGAETPAENQNGAEDSQQDTEDNKPGADVAALTEQIDALSKQVAALTTAQQVANIQTRKQPEQHQETPDDIIKFLAVGNDPAKRKEK